MKMKCLINIAAITALFTLGGCSQSDMPRPVDPDNGSTTDGNTFMVSASMDVPMLSTAQTRALGQSPDYAGLKLYAIEFECNNADDPSQNTILNIYGDQDGEIIDETPGDNIVTFTINLNKSVAPRVLHLIAVPEGADFGLTNNLYGTEAYVIPQLFTSGNNEAYWKRIVFENGYGTQSDADGWHTSPETKTKLTRVPMLRNFAQISVENAADDFIFTGFAVVNIPDRGAVAPWNYASGTFADFLFLDTADNMMKMKGYTEISSATGENYPGYMPSGTDLTNLSAEGLTYDSNAKYIYERPFPQNNLDRTFIIVRGHPASDTVDTYYKIDLGNAGDNGVFSYYNLLRNINYHVTIREVGASGYPTAAEAADGVVYNNFAFDVDTRTLTNISDGEDILFVNFTSAVITQVDQTEIEFKYRYRKVNSSGTYNNDNITFIGLAPGDVIQSVNDSDKTNDTNGWRTVKIKTYDPGDDVKIQTFTLIDQTTGLGRTITLILRKPWQLRDPEEFAGRFSWTYPDAAQAAERRGKAGYSTGRYLTVFFNLPDELNEAMFPLTFTVESDRQDIENDPIGNLLVTSGESMFVPGATRIQYEKTVTWRQYNEDKTYSNPNNTVVVTGDGRKIHRVRCRFLTITELPSSMTSLTSHVKIRNPYFDDVEVSFERSYGTNYEPITEPTE